MMKTIFAILMLLISSVVMAHNNAVVIPMAGEDCAITTGTHSSCTMSATLPVNWTTSDCSTGKIDDFDIEIPYETTPISLRFPAAPESKWIVSTLIRPDTSKQFFRLRFSESIDIISFVLWDHFYDTNVSQWKSNGRTGQYLDGSWVTECERLMLSLNSVRLSGWYSYLRSDVKWDVTPTFIYNGTTLTLKELLFTRQ